MGTFSGGNILTGMSPTGPVGPVEVFFYWPETVFGNFYWPGAIGSPLASSPGIVIKIFDGKMLITTLPAIHLQIFCKSNVNSKAIVKSIIDPEDN